MQDASEMDVTARPFKQWLKHRLMAAKRDSIDNLARKLLEDHRIPLRGSRSLYVRHLISKQYTVADMWAFDLAWREMYQEAQSEE